MPIFLQNVYWIKCHVNIVPTYTEDFSSVLAGINVSNDIIIKKILKKKLKEDNKICNS